MLRVVPNYEQRLLAVCRNEHPTGVWKGDGEKEPNANWEWKEMSKEKERWAFLNSKMFRFPWQL